jgi:hypothetical protein
MHDVRGLVIRVIKAQEKGKILEPTKVEGTILGVSKETFDEACTYPKCLNLSSFFRFMVAPTYCYQLTYPLLPKRSILMISRRLLEVLGTGLIVCYLWY